MPTKKGYELADRLGEHLGWTRQITEQCSAIARLATSYNTIQERWCNEEMSDALVEKLEKRETYIEKRLIDLVSNLPEPVGGAAAERERRVRFDGDPRGYTSRIVMPDGREIGLG